MKPELHIHYSGQYAMLIHTGFHHETKEGWAVFIWCESYSENTYVMPLKQFYGLVDTEKGKEARFKKVELNDIHI